MNRDRTTSPSNKLLLSAGIETSKSHGDDAVAIAGKRATGQPRCCGAETKQGASNDGLVAAPQKHIEK